MDEIKRRKIWFTSDLHFSHKNILKFHKGRQEEFGITPDMENYIELHDNRIIERWNYTIGKNDTVYILGDFSFADKEHTRKILEKLNGKKHIILGNHDASLKGLENYFESVSQIKRLVLKKHEFPFLNKTLMITMCHYPLLTWVNRTEGAFMLHGHCHGKIDELNENSYELRVDVGLDGKLCNYGFIEFEELYKYMLNKIKGFTSFEDYMTYHMSNSNERF